MTAGPFLTYWQSGYEGADHINGGGVLQDMNHANGHQQRAHEDYLLLQQFGIRTVRESIGWRLVERDGCFDFSVIEARVQAAQALGIQVCWTLLHYGWPEELDVYGDEFVPRFVRYCRAVAEFLKPFGGPAPVFSPVNEISFTSWGMSVGMFRHLNMGREHAARDVKRQLVRAAIAGCDAIWAVIPQARMLHCDPLIHIISHEDVDAAHAHAEGMRQSQFEAFDMLAGRRDPELGGAPRYLDLIGLNYYDTNQWEAATGHRLWWHLDDARRRPLHEMLLEVHARYGRPMLLAETGHVGSGRGIWIREVAEQAVMARQRGADLCGICLYPGIDRPDWGNADYWHHSGMWDVVPTPDDPQARVVAPAYAQGLRQAQSLTGHFHRALEREAHTPHAAAMPTILVFSHVRWDAAQARPRQVLGHLARYYRIVYVEEPVAGATTGNVETLHAAPNVTVCRPHVAGPGAGIDHDPWAAMAPVVAALVEDDAPAIAWFYTPLALPVLAAFEPGLIVYDWMDALSAAADASQQLREREAALLHIANLVFTSSAGFHDARRASHEHLHHFPDSVDTVHFEQALDRGNGHPAHAAIGGPRLGFHGAIDARLDGDLLAAVADAHPEWNIVLVGPVAPDAADSLPRRPNIHYPGPHTYRTWPQFLADWDVCLLPYAVTPSAPPPGPTHVLAYLAAERPVVATAIRDVEALYGDVVAIGRDAPAFIAACERALELQPAELDSLAARMRAIVGATSWTTVTDDMHALICRVREKLQTAARPGTAPREAIGIDTLSC